MNWANVQNALVAWIQAAGVSTVVWSNQDGPKPARDFVRLTPLGINPVGQDEVVQKQDLTRVGNGTTTVGTELEFQAEGLRELAIAVQCHMARAILTPLSTMSRLQTALRLQTVRSALLAVGLAPFDIGQPTDLTALVDSGYEGRAALTVRFYFTETISDFATFIQSCKPTMYTGPPDSGTRDTIDI